MQILQRHHKPSGISLQGKWSCHQCHCGTPHRLGDEVACTTWKIRGTGGPLVSAGIPFWNPLCILKSEDTLGQISSFFKLPKSGFLLLCILGQTQEQGISMQPGSFKPKNSCWGWEVMLFGPTKLENPIWYALKKKLKKLALVSAGIHRELTLQMPVYCVESTYLMILNQYRILYWINWIMILAVCKETSSGVSCFTQGNLLCFPHHWAHVSIPAPAHV